MKHTQVNGCFTASPSTITGAGIAADLHCRVTSVVPSSVKPSGMKTAGDIAKSNIVIIALPP